MRSTNAFGVTSPVVRIGQCLVIGCSTVAMLGDMFEFIYAGFFCVYAVVKGKNGESESESESESTILDSRTRGGSARGEAGVEGVSLCCSAPIDWTPEGTLVSVEGDGGKGGWGAVSVAVLDLSVGATMGSHKTMGLTVESKRALTELTGALMVARWKSALP